MSRIVIFIGMFLMVCSVVTTAGCTPVFYYVNDQPEKNKYSTCFDLLDHWVHVTTIQNIDGRYMPPKEFQKHKLETLITMREEHKDYAVVEYCVYEMEYDDLQCALKSRTRKEMLECL